MAPRRFVVGVAVVAASWSLLACGGAVTGGLAGENAGDAAGGHAPVVVSPTADAETPSHDAGMATTRDASVSPDDASVAVNDATVVDDATVEAPDGALPFEAGPVITANGLRCGDEATSPTCAAGTVCCAALTPFGKTSGACLASTTQCNDVNDVIVQCATNADCPAQETCCAAIEVPQVRIKAVACTTSCLLANSSDVVVVNPMCDPQGPATQCPSNGRCAPSESLPGYWTCAYAP